MHLSVGTQRHWIPLRLELEAVIALGTELGSSASEVPVAY